MRTAWLPTLENFSLVKGGPTYRLMVRLGLITGESYVRMAIYFTLLAWLPPFLLSLWRGLAIGNGLQIPFLSDFALHSRFLVALPLLILAEPHIDSRLRIVVKHFRRSNILTADDGARFDAAIQQVSRWRDSVLAEAVILLVVIVHFFVAISQRGWIPLSISSWYAIPAPSGPRLTPAGWWAAVIGSVFPFLFYRWIWRLITWGRFLWQVAKLDLQLVPTHPDLTGGLAFVGNGHSHFGMVMFAVSALGAGVCANQILLEGQTLRALGPLIGVFIAIVMALFTSPILLFTPPLYRLKKKGLLDYGALAMNYVQVFRAKWLGGNLSEGELMLGSPDFQSLADLQHCYATVKAMHIVALSRKAAFAVLASAAAPFLPLLLTEFPLQELVKQAVKMLI